MRTQTSKRAAIRPFYLPIADEIEIFRAAYEQHLPVLLKGPTGCGKTRFVEHMTWSLVPPSEDRPNPLITVACNEDLTASDLVGRYLIRGDETVWMDGPLTQAVRHGAVCYLDEIVEARKDTMVLIHPLTDHRRILPIDKLGQIIDAHPDFMLVVSYNPRRLVVDKTGEYIAAHHDFMMAISYNPMGYQSVLKDLEPSTRQRFVSLEFDYPEKEKEAQIVAQEGRVDPECAAKLVALAAKIRSMGEQGVTEGASTRLLIHAARLIGGGVAEKEGPADRGLSAPDRR